MTFPSLALSPLIRRDVLGMARSRLAIGLTLLAVLASSLVPLLVWPEGESRDAGAARNSTVFILFFWTQLTSILLAVPILVSGTIAGERERGTYELLLAAPIPAASIVASKLLAPIACLSLLITGTLPAAAFLFLLGGISPGVLGRCYAVMFAAMILAAAVSLAVSVKARSTARALVVGLILVALLTWGGSPLILTVPAMVAMLPVLCRPPIALAGCLIVTPTCGFLLWMALVHPPLLMMSLLISPYTALASLIRPDSPEDMDSWSSYAGCAAVISLGIILWLLANVTRLDLNGRTGREVRSGSSRARIPGAMLREPRGVLVEILTDCGKAGVPFLSNPVFLREARHEPGGGARYRRTLFVGTAVILLASSMLLMASSRGDPDSSWITLHYLVALGTVVLIAPAGAATSFTREKERDNLDALRGTRLSPREILGGKVLASLVSCIGPGLAALAVTSFGAILHLMVVPIPEDLLLLASISPAIFLLATLFTTLLGTLVSILSRSSVAALLAAYTSTFVLFAGIPLLLDLAAPEWPFVASINPFLALRRLSDNMEEALPHALRCMAVLGGGSVALAAVAARSANRLWKGEPGRSRRWG